jgi:hypothetical protein
MRTSIPTIVAASLLLASPAAAHHSAAMFDFSKTMTVEGVVRSFDWANPHAYLEVIVVDSGGQAGDWRLEGSSINILARKGWSKSSVKPGDKVSVSLHPMRDGSRGGFILTLKPAAGMVLVDHDY